MSTVKSKNLQIGTDGTASNNFTIYQPGTPDGTLRVGNGNVGSATDAVTINSSGNVGIGTSSPSYKLDVTGSIGIKTNDAFYRGTSVAGNSVRLVGLAADDNVYVGSIDSLAGSNTIFRTNGTERMRIDSSGRVTMPYQPAFMAKSTVGTVTYSGGDVIPFASFLTQTGSEYSTSTSRFTASVAGNYFFSTLIYFQGTGSLAFNKNGSEVGGVSPLLIAQAGGWSGTMSIVIYLAANDYVDVRSRSSTSSTIFGGHSTFQGFLIG